MLLNIPTKKHNIHHNIEERATNF